MKMLIIDLAQEGASLQSIGIVGNDALASQLMEYGLIDQAGKFIARNVSDHAYVVAGLALKEGLTKAVAEHSSKVSSIIFWGGLNKLYTTTRYNAFSEAKSYAFADAFAGVMQTYSGQTTGQAGIDIYQEKGMRANLLSNIHKWGSKPS